MKLFSNTFAISILGGFAVTSIGMCLMAIPTLIVGSANPHGIANVLVTIGAVLCFALLRYVVEIPLFVCFLLAVIAWTALITGVRYIVKST